MNAENHPHAGSNVSIAQRAWNIRRKALLMGEVQGQGYIGQALGIADVLAKAEAAGARVLKPAHDVFWGGHIAYFADPEGHVWELAWNPFSPLSDEGAFRWDGYGAPEA